MSIKRKRFEQEELEGLRDIILRFRKICELNRQKENELRQSLESYIEGRLLVAFNETGDDADMRAMRKAVYYYEPKEDPDE